MRVADHYHNGKKAWARMHGKGGKFHEVPVHYRLEDYLDTYVERQIASLPKTARSSEGRWDLVSPRRPSQGMVATSS